MTLDVIRCSDLANEASSLATLLRPWGVDVRQVAAGEPIPGTFWGEPEAGIVGRALHVRPDTPVHSALHEACHVICAGRAGRGPLHTDAGGTFAEEDAVCYLQILLAGELPGVGSKRMMADMDAWGYTFRLGSAAAWFAGDAEDALDWLVRHRLADSGGRPLPGAP